MLLICAMWAFMFDVLIPDGFHYAGAIPLESPDAQRSVAALTMQTIPTQGSALSRITWLAFLVFGVALIASRSNRALKLFRRTNPFLLLFVGLAVVSAVWSIEPTVTVRRCIRLITTASDAAAFVLLARSSTNLTATLRSIYTTFLIGSIVFVMVSPTNAIEQLAQAELIGAWHGLAAQKNGLGAISALTLLLWAHAVLSKETALWRGLLGIAIAGLCLVKSRSSTSIMAAFFAVGLLLMLMRPPSALRRYMPYIVTLYIGLLLIYSLAVLDMIPGSGLLLSPITGLVGKDLTFSGRTAIWQVIRENIALHPILGGGYGAYWTGLPNSPSMLMLKRVFFYPTESHNGYIDIYNDLGLVGEFCLVGYIIMYVRQSVSVYAKWRSQGALYLALLFLLMIGNLSEARWFNALADNDMLITMLAALAMTQNLAEISAGNSRSRAALTPRHLKRGLSSGR